MKKSFAGTAWPALRISVAEWRFVNGHHNDGDDGGISGFSRRRWLLVVSIC